MTLAGQTPPEWTAEESGFAELPDAQLGVVTNGDRETSSATGSALVLHSSSMDRTPGLHRGGNRHFPVLGCNQSCWVYGRQCRSVVRDRRQTQEGIGLTFAM